MHGALLWYFRQEVKFDEEENSGVPPIAEQVVSGCSRQSFVVIEEKSCTADPLDYQRPPMSEPSACPAEEFEEVEIEELPRRPPKQVPVADEFEEVEIEEIPLSCHSHRVCPGVAPMDHVTSPNHVPGRPPEYAEKLSPYSNDGDIPFSGPFQRSISVRDIDELLVDDAFINNTRSAHMWIRVLEDLRPEDLPYSIFGIEAFRYKGLSVGAQSAPLPPIWSAPTARSGRFRGVWADPDEDTSEARSESDHDEIDTSAPSKPSLLSQRILFAFRPVRSYDVCLAAIQFMRHREVFLF